MRQKTYRASAIDTCCGIQSAEVPDRRYTMHTMIHLALLLRWVALRDLGTVMRGRRGGVVGRYGAALFRHRSIACKVRLIVEIWHWPLGLKSNA